MEDMLAQLEQGVRFSKIDLRQAYLQLPLDDASKTITTINTSKGLYTYNRLPFGVTSSPAIWQKTMDSILQGLSGVQCNQDDMIVTGNTEEEHYQNLHSVLRRLQEYGLKANLHKCRFFQPKVLFCGISITKDGLHKPEDKIQAVTEASTLHPWQFPEKPWQRIHIDYAGPFLNQMFLVIVDAHRKWVEIIPTTMSTMSTTVNILGTIFARFGIPEQVVSDNSPQFTSEEFKTFMYTNNIRHVRSAPYHPATNGIAERMVQSFKNAMKAAKHDKGTIHLKLARFLLAYRNAPHSTTGETPATLMFGRRLRTKLDICSPNLKSSVEAKQRQQEKHHSQASPRTFTAGDHVLVRDNRGHEKLQHGQVSAQTGTRNYEIEISPGVVWRRHSDQIRHASNPVPLPQATSIMLNPPSPVTRITLCPITPSHYPPDNTSYQTDGSTRATLLEEPHTSGSSMPSDPQSDHANSDTCNKTEWKSSDDTYILHLVPTRHKLVWLLAGPLFRPLRAV
ncbi:polyprotein [Elysia marginata]|uniref:Polyprotein n=1 Tax=Elysia marginata TaxID=1093978 RepID=A0AAV4FC46_9GAST|nr:polyprotein [Elysia marginata]